jgi:hypothetical protein
VLFLSMLFINVNANWSGATIAATNSPPNFFGERALGEAQAAALAAHRGVSAPARAAVLSARGPAGLVTSTIE